jgi:hypothetical protein
MRNETIPNVPSQNLLRLVSLALIAAAVPVWLVPVAFAGSFAYPSLQIFVWQVLLTFALLIGGLFAQVAAEGRLAGEGSVVREELQRRQTCHNSANTPVKQHAPTRAATLAVPTPTHVSLEHCGALTCQGG